VHGATANPGNHEGAETGGQHFRTTAWSVVAQAGQSDSPQAMAALEKLCQSYWYPIYAELRRRGISPHDAQDLTQDFFACLLRRGSIAAADRSKGRFRSYLLGALKYFLADEYDKRRAEKRGGGQPIVSLDEDEAESRFRQEPAPGASPDQAFDRRWALALMDRAFHRLNQEHVESNKNALFQELKLYLGTETDAGGYAGPASRLGMTTSAIGVAVHRLRQRYRELIRLEAAETLASIADVDDELRHLFGG
jgi:DNA-directed RNA polymerase specialized sigma24 family protein